jgi:hypothetical protein
MLLTEFSIEDITYAKHGKEAIEILDKTFESPLSFDWIILDY